MSDAFNWALREGLSFNDGFDGGVSDGDGSSGTAAGASAPVRVDDDAFLDRFFFDLEDFVFDDLIFLCLVGFSLGYEDEV
jgi:hypothetical protein